jgi:uncharacterized DUF497 family protein
MVCFYSYEMLDKKLIVYQSQSRALRVISIRKALT